MSYSGPATETKEQKTIDYVERQGHLKELTGLVGIESMQDHQDEVQANREAESSYIRREVWGESVGGLIRQGVKKMRQTIGGDYHVHGTDIGKLAIGAGLMVAGYFIAQAMKPAEQPKATDTEARVKVLWGDKELKPGDSASVTVED